MGAAKQSNITIGTEQNGCIEIEKKHTVSRDYIVGLSRSRVVLKLIASQELIFV